MGNGAEFHTEEEEANVEIRILASLLPWLPKNKMRVDTAELFASGGWNTRSWLPSKISANRNTESMTKFRLRAIKNMHGSLQS